MKKELRPIHDDVSCEVCGRTILKGERTIAYLAPGGQRKVVCELCTARADHEGWIRESAHADLPTTRARPEARRSLIGRMRRRRTDNGGPAEPELAPEEQEETPPALDRGAPPEHGIEVASPPRPRRPKDPRHVRAVPTNAEVKVERALELFNASDHPRTIAGIARTLGAPWVSAVPSEAAPSEVVVVVAWELSWYRFRVDLGDAREPVALLEKGEELADIDEELRDWNGSADAAGRLAPGVGSEER